MSQDIISFGLDVTSFDAKKKKTLQEFITLFDKLSKYDGMKVNPVAGDGLSSFNASLKATSLLLDELKTKIELLNKATVKPSVSAANMFPSTAVRQYTKDVDKATEATKKHEAQITIASAKATQFGKELTRAFSLIRQAAYILPGIGIAGIFNLAFEAIGKVLEEFGALGGAETRQVEFVNAMNTAWLELEQTYLKVYEAQQKITSFNLNTIDQSKRETGILKATGISQESVLPKELNDAAYRAFNAEKALQGQYKDGVVGLKNDLENINKTILNNAQEINRLRGIVASGNKEWSSGKMIEKLQSDNQLLEFDYKNKEKVYTEYFNSIYALGEKKAEYEKYQADQSRKLLVETTRDNIAVELDKQKTILGNERSTEKERIDAVNNIFRLEKELSAINRINVVTNNSNSSKEKEIARNKEADENKRSDIKNTEEREKILTEFYQRFIKAKSEITKDDIEQDAIANERVYKNEEKTLEERLLAYNNYILDKQALQDIEYQKDIQRGAFSKTGKTSLTQEEKDSLKSGTDTQKVNIQADAEKQIYNIVFSSLQNQLKEVMLSNKLQEKENTRAYTEELVNLNKSFEDKKISYRKFVSERKKIDEKYRVSGLDEDIIDDKKDIERLQKYLNGANELRKKAADELEISALNKKAADGGDGNKLDADKNYAEAVGNQNAINDAIKKAELDLQLAKEKLDKDELERAKKKYDTLIEYQKEYALNNRAILDELFKLAKNLIDQEYQQRIEALQRRQDTVDEVYSKETDAIERSSLSAKDKNALDVQLNAEKVASDKAAAAEERKIKHDNAVADQKLSVARAIWNTADAVSLAIATISPPFGEAIAIQRGILGALQVATILATPIPSYEFGTENHPGGLARYGEAGPELVKEPYRSPYLIMGETISYLPKGTEVIPIKDSPVFGESVSSDGWEQVRYLARQMRKSSQSKTKNINIIKIDLGFERYKKTILE